MSQPDTGNGGTVKELVACDGCGCLGMRADTTSGEIIGQDGGVVGSVPEGVTILMVGDANGRRTNEILCEACGAVSPDVKPNESGALFFTLGWIRADSKNGTYPIGKYEELLAILRDEYGVSP